VIFEKLAVVTLRPMNSEFNDRSPGFSRRHEHALMAYACCSLFVDLILCGIARRTKLNFRSHFL
jgi:hypothetical protein